MKILGVDPGSRAAGWAVVDFAGKPVLVAAGVLRPPPIGTFAESLIALGEARGVLLLALAHAGIATAEVTPAEIKRAVAGSGGAEKEQVRRMVGALLGRHLALDAADAAAAALTHRFVAARRGASFAPAPRALTSFLAGVKRRPAG